jgi:retron-type reverse transcriptase
VNFILDADIRSFLDTVNHEWLIKLEHRIGDKRATRSERRVQAIRYADRK